MNIYSPLETQQRELDARILFCIQAAKLGHNAYFGHKSDLFPIIPKLKKGIFLHKSIQKRKLDQINYLKSLGHFNCSIDEEAIMIPDEEEYFNHRCSKACISQLDLFLAWGHNHEQMIIKKYPEFKEKIISAGNSRIDVLKHKKNYLDFASEIKNKYGKFILFVTKFGRYNLKKRGWDSWLDMKLANAPNLSKNSYERIKNSIEFEKKNMQLTMQTIIKMAKEFPDKQILIRPHPTENIDTWNKFAESSTCSNIKIAFTSQSLNPWLLAAEHVISNNCTSSLESLIMGITSINYIPYTNPEMEYDLPKLCSHTFRTYEELKKFFKKEKKFSFDTKNLEKYIKNFGEKSFCDILVSFLEKNVNQKIYSSNNKHFNILLLTFHKYYKNFRKFISLNFGALRRRREIVKQKCPGFSINMVKEIAQIYGIPEDIKIKEVWAGVYLFEKL